MIRKEFTDATNLARLKAAYCVLKDVVVEEGPDRVLKDLLNGHLIAWITVLQRSVDHSLTAGIDQMISKITGMDGSSG